MKKIVRKIRDKASQLKSNYHWEETPAHDALENFQCLWEAMPLHIKLASVVITLCMLGLLSIHIYTGDWS